MFGSPKGVPELIVSDLWAQGGESVSERWQGNLGENFDTRGYDR